MTVFWKVKGIESMLLNEAILKNTYILQRIRCNGEISFSMVFDLEEANPPCWLKTYRSSGYFLFIFGNI